MEIRNWQALDTKSPRKPFANCCNSFYIHCYLLYLTAVRWSRHYCPFIKKPTIRGLVMVQGHVAREGWPADVRPGSSLSELLSILDLIQLPPPPDWTSQYGPIIVNFESTEHNPRVWICILNHCFNSALGFWCSRGNHTMQQVSSPWTE